MKLTGFSEALAVMPVQELETERSFGKGKATAKDAEVEPSERKFGIKVDKRGTFRLNPAVYNRGE